MREREIMAECNVLIACAYDAIRAYDQAVDAVEHPAVRDKLLSFRSDHVRHIADFSVIVRRLGGVPPQSPPGGSYRMEGSEEALRKLRRFEIVLQKKYTERTELPLPADVLDVLRRNLAEEERHLIWIEQALESRAWELPVSAPII